jgi:TetR/AcrR family transcriptional regulator, regulator of autoinduction and epiphytic fitness
VNDPGRASETSEDDGAAGAPAPGDGRVRRGERTRASIVNALLDLITSGELEPTSQLIADTAGVSVRSIFQHFADLEELYGALAQAQADRTTELFGALETEGDLDTRLSHLVSHRAKLYESIAAVRHAIGNRARHSPALAARLARVDELLRAQLGRQFEDELAGCDATLHARTLDTLDLLWSFEAWDRLRNAQGLDVDSASAVLEAVTRQLLPPRQA